MPYLAVVEPTGDGLSACVPDLLGCVAAGDTVEDVKELLSEAVCLYLEALADDGTPAPKARCIAELVEV